MHVAYIRVSTLEQNEDRQLEAMKRYPIEKFFTEKISAKDMNRPELQKMLEFVREGDVVHIHDFSRLARSTKDLLEIVELLKKKGVALVSNKENIDSTTPTGKLMLTMIAAINEFERTNLHERQREGIDIAKRKGVYHGRQRKEVPDFGRHYLAYALHQTNKAQLAKDLGISRPVIDRLIREYEESHGGAAGALKAAQEAARE